MSDIFISYSSTDRVKAKGLAEALMSQGWSVWWDRKILPGESYDVVIERALVSARCVVVLWSSASVASNWVKAEAGEGADRGVLVPVFLEKVRIPLEFRRIQTADLSGWEPGRTHQGFEEVLKAITVLLANGGTADTVENEPLPMTQPVQAVDRPPAVPQVKKGWRAELVSSSWTKRIIRVHLSHSTHEVEFHNDMEKMRNAETIKVDGEVVSSGGNSITWKHRFEFQISDGAASYPAIVELEPNKWLATLKKFRLIIAGKVIYSEGKW